MYTRRDQPEPISILSHQAPVQSSPSLQSNPSQTQSPNIYPPMNGTPYGAQPADPYKAATHNPSSMALPPGIQWEHDHGKRMGTVSDPLSVKKDGRQYSLTVAQQPVRARMCGFGDKDRRPITPPPCIRLIIKDLATGQEIDPGEIDSTYFVLTVDLWSADGETEVNLVRGSSHASAVSISATHTTSYPPPPERSIVRVDMAVPTQPYGAPQPGLPMAGAQYPMASAAPGFPGGPPLAQHPAEQQAYGMPPQAAPSQQNPYGQPPPPPGHHAGAGVMPPMMQAAPPPPPVPQAPPGYMLQVNSVASHAPTSGMFTRNLIGSLSVNAFKLVDTEGKVGFWFVLQDLSVRTEGWFRLKMNFVDVGTNDGTNRLTTGKAPVLASSFSNPFQVYSAKKFPGVIESTPLSKAFASQGIKIPIRKDGPKVTNADEYENDD